MKKKLLAILMMAAMSMSLIACGGGEDEGAANNNAAAEQEQNDAADTEGPVFSEEQAALAQEYIDLCEAYDAAADRVNNTPSLLEQEEIVNTMNEVADALISLDECFGDPELLTEEVMVQVKDTIAKGYKFVDEVNALVDGEETGSDITIEDMASVFTIGYAGADEEENTYYFISDEDVVSAGLVYLSADATEHLVCVGDTVENEDGSFTIVDTDGELKATIAVVEELEGGLVLLIDNEIEVTMVPYDSADVIEMIFTIETETQSIN